jgi:hypothetical protein
MQDTNTATQAARLLGSIKTEKKAKASRENGKRGGRPRGRRTGAPIGRPRTRKFYTRGELNPLWGCWSNMHRRCSPDSPKRPRYFDRGITVCEEWKDWDTFAEFALSHGWEPGLTIDRTDNDKGYSPENVRFVTRAENTRNRDPRHMAVVYGKERQRQRPPNKACRPVVAVSPQGTTHRFKRAIEAAEFIGIKKRNGFYEVLRGRSSGRYILNGWKVRYDTKPITA